MKIFCVKFAGAQVRWILISDFLVENFARRFHKFIKNKIIKNLLYLYGRMKNLLYMVEWPLERSRNHICDKFRFILHFVMKWNFSLKGYVLVVYNGMLDTWWLIDLPLFDGIFWHFHTTVFAYVFTTYFDVVIPCYG